MRHSGGAKGVRIETGVQPGAPQGQRVASLDPTQIVGELVDGVIAHVCSHVRNPGIDQGRIDNAVTLIGKAVRVGVNKKILAGALDAEDHAVNHVPLDRPIHRVSQHVGRGRGVDIRAIGTDKIVRTLGIGNCAFGEVATPQVPGTVPGQRRLDLIVQARGRKVLCSIKSLIPLHVLHEFRRDTRNGHQAGARLRAVDLAQDPHDGRIHRTGETRIAGHCQQVHGTLDAVRAHVGVVTLLRG